MSEESIQNQLDQQHTRLNSQSESITTLVQSQATATSNIITLTETLTKSIENNEREHERTREEIRTLRESKNKTLLPSVLVIAGIMVSMSMAGIAASWLVLTPIGAALNSNQDEIHSVADTQIETRITNADTLARLSERQNQLSERIDNLRIKDGQWLGADGKVATPAPHYQPFQRIE